MSDNKKIKLLYVDDEANNLISFKASFRFDYDIQIANNTDEALNMLEQHNDISVVLSDQRMPDRTGVEFFEEVRKKFPYPVRILITGYADIESVISAINRGNIFRYIKKPWTDVDIRSAVDEAHKFYMATTMLAKKNEELQKAYTELDKFAYSATHDIRGPILSMLGIINIAKDTDDKNDIKNMLIMVEEAITKLDSYIISLHDHYNVRRGELQISNINFDEVVKDMNALFEVTSKVENIKFSTSLQQDAPFRSDETSIKIIITNLLSNAFKYQKKYAEDKLVNLGIKIHNNVLEIIVEDNGIGIPAESINHIFSMFYRGAHQEFGSGFGLYNVKDALAKINGKIEVESKEGLGTNFKVIIPGK